MRCKTTLGPTEWGTKGKTYPNLCLFCWGAEKKMFSGTQGVFWDPPPFSFLCNKN